MQEFVTIGETMISLVSNNQNPIQYGTNFSMRIAGAESNTAIGVQKLGHQAGWISRIGNDEFGHYLLRMIRAEGIDVSQVSLCSEHKTGIMFKSISMSRDTLITYYRDLSAATYMTPSDINEAYIANAKILHLSGITPILSKSCYETVQCAIEIAKSHGVKISFDPNIRLKLWRNNDYSHIIKDIISKSDIILMGISEANHIFHTDIIENITDTIFTHSHAQHVALKDGKNGAWVANGGELLFIPPVECSSVDSVGAGDAFNAGFLSGILDKKDLKTCGLMGGIAGAYATSTYGDIEGLLSKNEMYEILENRAVITR